MRVITQERRERKRYPLELEVRFTVRPRGQPETAGRGRSLDISSSGLGLRSTTKMTSGDYVFVTVAWPISSAEGLPLQLAISGRVVWSDRSTAGLSFTWHRFISGSPPSGRASEDLPSVLMNLPPGARTRLILVVENPDLYLRIAAMLARCHDIIRHVTVQAALELLKAPGWSVDLLVTNTIRQFIDFADAVPIIYTGSHGGSELERLGIAGSSVVWLPRPIRLAELCSAARWLLSRNAAPRPPVPTAVRNG